MLEIATVLISLALFLLELEAVGAAFAAEEVDGCSEEDGADDNERVAGLLPGPVGEGVGWSGVGEEEEYDGQEGGGSGETHFVVSERLMIDMRDSTGIGFDVPVRAVGELRTRSAQSMGAFEHARRLAHQLWFAG